MNTVIPVKTAKQVKKAIRFFCLALADKGGENEKVVERLNPDKMKALNISESELIDLLNYEQVLTQNIELYESS